MNAYSCAGACRPARVPKNWHRESHNDVERHAHGGAQGRGGVHNASAHTATIATAPPRTATHGTMFISSYAAARAAAPSCSSKPAANPCTVGAHRHVRCCHRAVARGDAREKVESLARGGAHGRRGLHQRPRLHVRHHDRAAARRDAHEVVKPHARGGAHGRQHAAACANTSAPTSASATAPPSTVTCETMLSAVGAAARMATENSADTPPDTSAAAAAPPRTAAHAKFLSQVCAAARTTAKACTKTPSPCVAL